MGRLLFARINSMLPAAISPSYTQASSDSSARSDKEPVIGFRQSHPTKRDEPDNAIETHEYLGNFKENRYIITGLKLSSAV